MWRHASIVLCIWSLVCLTPPCVYCWAWGGVTKDKEKKVKLQVWRTEHAHRWRVACYLGPYFTSSSPMRPAQILLSQILFTRPAPWGASRFCPVTFSDQLAPMDFSDSFHSGFPVIQESWKGLAISGFFVPFSRALFSPTLIQDRKVQTHGWPTGLPGCWCKGQLLPPSSIFSRIARIHLHTHLYVNCEIHKHTHRQTHTHTHTHTHTNTHTNLVIELFGTWLLTIGYRLPYLPSR